MAEYKNTAAESGLIDVERIMASKLSDKYGYVYDMSLLFVPFRKVRMGQLREAFNSIVRYGNFTIDREITVEEYLEKAYSVYMRRFTRMPSSLVVSHYSDTVGEEVLNSHLSLFADSPDIVGDGRGVVRLVELGGGHVDVDSLSAPGFFSIEKVEIDKNLTAIRVIYNSVIHRAFWADMVDINLFMGVVMSKVLACDALYGRSTCISVQDEVAAIITRGEVKDVISERAALREMMRSYNLDVNKILDKFDYEISTATSVTEFSNVQRVLNQALEMYKCDKHKIKLVRKLENEVLPYCRKIGRLPKLSEVYKLAKGFIDSSTEFTDEELGERTTKEGEVISPKNEMYRALTHIILSYITYLARLNVDARADVMYGVMKFIDPKYYKDPVNLEGTRVGLVPPKPPKAR